MLLAANGQLHLIEEKSQDLQVSDAFLNFFDVLLLKDAYKATIMLNTHFVFPLFYSIRFCQIISAFDLISILMFINCIKKMLRFYEQFFPC